MSQPINWKENLPMLAVLIVLALLVVLSIYPQTNLTYDQKSCILSGGQWAISQCGSGEGGQSSAAGGLSTLEIICEDGSVGQPGCYCGANMYWDSYKLKCLVNP
jgi:hypothetical protein